MQIAQKLYQGIEIEGETIGVAISMRDKAKFDEFQLKKWCSKLISREKIPTKWFNVDSIPKNERGKITLITRMGSQNIYDKLPNLIKSVRENQNNVIWSCDPMHANTYKSSTGYKTRSFDKILSEIEAFFNVHHQEGSFPGGIHLELTGLDVTECVGGSQKIKEENLSDRYHTHCDPRLNASQGLDLAFKLSEFLKIKKG